MSTAHSHHDNQSLQLRENTLTAPSPPQLMTHLPSGLQTTLHTPSPLIMRWLDISCVQLLFSRDQNRRLASCPPDTNSLPSGLNDSEEIDDGCASIVYVHCPVPELVAKIREGEPCHTTISIEEANITILIPSNHHTLNTTFGPRRPVDNIILTHGPSPTGRQ